MIFSSIFNLYRVFSSHMVLQRQKTIVFSGQAEPGKYVRAEFAGLVYEAAADENGEWRCEFPALPAGGPYRLTLRGAVESKAIILEDILIGEVWLCSGQSNMEMPIDSENPFFHVQNPQEVLKKAICPQLRIYNNCLAQRISPDKPLTDVDGDGWQVCSPDSIANFSACAYFFGRRLTSDLDIPVGIISSAQGGTDIEAWISHEKFQEYQWAPFFDSDSEITEKWEAVKTGDEYRNAELWMKDFDALEDCSAAFLEPDFDDSNWQRNEQSFQRLELPGRYLCRMHFDLPEELNGKNLSMKLGLVNDVDHTYLNGELVGATGLETFNYWNIERTYAIPARALRKGRNCVTIVADNHCGYGQMPSGEILLKNGESEYHIPTACCWRTLFLLENRLPVRPAIPYFPSRGKESPNYPSTLFNAMIAPWHRIAIRGVIWYQGCNNNGQFTYYPLHKMLIDNFRENWRNPEMPFLLVQLAAFHVQQPDARISEEDADALPVSEFSAYALTREIQAEMPHICKNVGLVTAFDCGDHSDIHPRDKQTVGERLARKAESMVYGRRSSVDGPVFDGFRLEKQNVRVFFKNAEEGLTTVDGAPPRGFILGDRDGNLFKADAAIDGSTVLVHCSEISEPQRVRYAYTGYCRVNLINRAGEPALPFRSDKLDYQAMFQYYLKLKKHDEIPRNC